MTWASVNELKAVTRARKRREPERGDFFGPEETRFFDSTYDAELYGGRYFVESSQFHGSSGSGPRKWHVVRAGGEHDEPRFDTIGPWGSDGYGVPHDAHDVARACAAAETAGRLVERADRSERFAECAPCRAAGKEHPSWATFVFSAPGENEPFDVCAEHVPEVVTS